MDFRTLARQRLARARNAVGDTVALMFVDAVLWPLSGENFGEAADRLLTGAGGREARRALGRR